MISLQVNGFGLRPIRVTLFVDEEPAVSMRKVTTSFALMASYIAPRV